MDRSTPDHPPTLSAEPARPAPRPVSTATAPGILVALAAALLVALLAGPAASLAADGASGPRLDAPPEDLARLSLRTDRPSYAPGAAVHVEATVEIADGWHVNSNTPSFEWMIPTALRFDLPDGWIEPTVEYPDHELQSFGFIDEPIAVYDGRFTLDASLFIPESVATDTVDLRAVLEYQACDDRRCLAPTELVERLTLPIRPDGVADSGATMPDSVAGSSATDAGEASSDEASSDNTGAAAGPGLVWMLVLGLIGGLILNAMPCVLPVLSIKVFGLVQSAGEGRAAVTRGALATSAGILLSFWALGLAAVAARAAGSAVGWGVQFQNPLFVTVLLVIVVLFCLNLWGLFEIPLPRALAELGGSGPREGLGGHMFSGLFATLMATPCSAPFLGTAVGFALGQPPVTILAVFTAIGLGMASPYLLLAAVPGAAGLLPKPGAWMDAVRKVMGFLLAGAAVWLLYVLAAQISPERLAWIQLALLGLGLAVWLRHRAEIGPLSRRLALGVAGVLVVATLALGARPAEVSADLGAEAKNLIAWETFDRARAEELAAGGRLVFVDVTADWCFTCKVNERLVLETRPVADAFERHGVVTMKADWTNRDDTIGAFLEDHGRYGIPFYLLYRPGEEPHVFGELLTRETVIETVESSAAALAG